MTSEYTEVSKKELRELIQHDVDNYLKQGGKIKVYDEADNLVSEYNSEEE